MSEYRVPNMAVVPQDNNNACWYASAIMILRWRGRFRDPFAAYHPLYHSRDLRLHQANNGLPWSQMVQFARGLGLVPVPPLRRAPRVEDLMALLMQFGPLWADGAPLDQHGNFAGIGHV